jgi:hypothetical protein
MDDGTRSSEEELMRKQALSAGAAAVLLLIGTLPAMAQRPVLAPMPPRGLPVSPFMEGWYGNEDGSVTVSFGYLNRNREDAVLIPIGERNSIEPAQFSGMQPTVFLPGRHRGVFVVTIPPELVGNDVWWTITNENGEVHRVPGRSTSEAYTLDRLPRPAGTLPPRVALAEDGPWGGDPTGVIADRALSARVGSPTVLTVWTEDPSQRDPSDPRFEEGKPLRVLFLPHHSSPEGEITFTRHESTVDVAPAAANEDDDGGREPEAGPETVMLPEGAGVARVYATFSHPGEYLVRAQVDNWRAVDSSSGNQCCWSNAYIRVNVQP